VHDAVEPDPPIDDSIHGKLDRILAELAALRKGTATPADGEHLVLPGVGEPITLITKPAGVGSQQFGFDEENLNPEIVAYVQKHQLNEGVSK
jgi:hypothetical protein